MNIHLFNIKMYFTSNIYKKHETKENEDYKTISNIEKKIINKCENKDKAKEILESLI